MTLAATMRRRRSPTNTAAFNCRYVVGRPGVWSEHASGRAIDVNPLVNPYTLDPNVGRPEGWHHSSTATTTPSA